MNDLQEIIHYLQQNQAVGIVVAIVAVIIAILIVVWLIKLIWRIITFPFRLIFGSKKEKETSQLHRSEDWGGNPHVELYERDSRGKKISESHGHSPTIYPPPREDGAIKLGKKKDLPPPYGKVDINNRIIAEHHS